MIPINSQSHTPTVSERWVARDLAVLWHPCTQMQDHESWPPVVIKHAKGVWLEDFEGKRYLDAISSWWVNLFGHADPRIDAALSDQIGTLEQVMLAGLTHTPAIELAERLVRLAPLGLTRCFFADNGSCAVEIALKMSFHCWQNLGHARKRRFIHLENSYHGETLGALAVCGAPLYRKIYQPLLLDAIQAPSPDCFFRDPGESWESYSRRQFAHMRALLERHAEEVCAVIVEPLVQGAGLMRMYHPVYLSLLRATCDRYKVHLIADEVAVGFGRTGTLFACEQAGITPDLMCVSKGLTGGYLPLAAVLATEPIYQAFYDDYVTLSAFLHSHSYSGNPLACRAALATLDIFEQEPVLKRNAELATVMRESTTRFVEHPHVAEVRQQGMILAIELVQDKATRKHFPWQQRRGRRVFRLAMDRGALLRPMGDVVYFMPPYVIIPDEIRWLSEIAWGAIDQATRD